MATNSFNISYIISAVDKFSPVIKNVQKSLKGLDKNLASIGTKGIKKLADKTKKVETNFKKVAEQTQKVKAKIQTLPPKIDTVTAKTNKAALSAKKLANRFKQAGDRAKNIGKSLALRVTAPLLAVGALSIRNAKIQIEAERKVRTGVELLGKRSAFTTDQLFKQASALQLNSNFGDEAILDGAINSLLRFEGIATNKKIFTAVTQGVIDIAAKTGKPLKGVADTLGRALQEPLTQLSLLERTVTFSAKEKERIKELAKAGDLVGAQLSIMKAVREQFGGFAKDLSETDVGQLNQGMMALGDSSESVGKILIKALVPLLKKVKEIALAFDALSPEVKKNIVKVALFAAAIAPVLITIGLMTTGLIALKVATIGLLTKALIPLGVFLLTNPLGLLITGVVLLTAGIITLAGGWEKILFFIQKTIDAALIFFGLKDKKKALGTFEEEKQLKRFLPEGGLKREIARNKEFLSGKFAKLNLPQQKKFDQSIVEALGGAGNLNEASKASVDVRNEIRMTVKDKGGNIESISATPNVQTAIARGSNSPFAAGVGI